MKSGEIDAHDPMYDIGPVANTVDASWGRVQTFDSYKWQHICYNLKHPVFGTGVDTPLGKQDPSRAAEAAAYIRQAISHAMPRDEIVKGIAGGYGAPGTVPIAWSSPEYDHDLLQAHCLRHGAGEELHAEGRLHLLRSALMNKRR